VAPGIGGTSAAIVREPQHGASPLTLTFMHIVYTKPLRSLRDGRIYDV